MNEEETVAQKAAARRERLLAKQAERLRVVSGEAEEVTTTSPQKKSDAENKQVKEVTPPPQQVVEAEKKVEEDENDNSKPRWERKWEKDVQSAERRVLASQITESLKTTEDLFVDGGGDTTEALLSKEHIEQVINDAETSSPMTRFFVPIATVVTFVMFICGILLGSSVPPLELRPLEANALPYESAFVMALVIQGITHVSFRVLGVKQEDPAANLPWPMDKLFAFLPSDASATLLRVGSLAFGVKDAMENTLVFGVGFAIARTVATLLE